MTPPHSNIPRPRDTRGRGARLVAPSLGRAITSPADVRQVWKRHLGDQPVPPPRPRPNPLTEQEWQERARRAQLEAARQRLTGTTEAPWPEVESAWIESIRLARAVLQPTDPTKGTTR